MFEKPQAVEIYDLVDALHSCKQALGKFVIAHVFEMKGYMDQLHALGKSYDNDMAINLINRSLNKDFVDFVKNFNMHCVGKTVTELHALLIDYEKGLKGKAPTPQGFKEERKLSYGEQYLQVGNGAQAAVEAIGVFDLVLPSGLVLKLNNCYYAPSIVRGVISLSCLSDLGFNHTIHLTSPYTPQPNGVSEKRNHTLLDMVRSMFNLTTLPLSFWDYALESAVHILNMVPTKKVDKKPYKIWHGKAGVRLIPVRRSERTMRAPNRLCLNIKVEDDEVGDIGEPVNYKAAMLNPDKTFLLMPRAIRILIAIAAYYDYEIWQIDVKTAFLNGRLDEDIYMEQPEGYVDPKYPNRKYNMHNSKNGYFPMEVKHDLSNELYASTPEEVVYMKKVPYASAVGSIMYAVRYTRPDVAFSQNLFSRYQHNPWKLHWVAVKHILNYLRNTRDMFLVYGGKPDTELDITGFCDASWQYDKDDTKSQTGYVFVVNGGAGRARSRLQLQCI
nr:putative retrotransposon protein [Tanacetum cinerariifolium]